MATTEPEPTPEPEPEPTPEPEPEPEPDADLEAQVENEHAEWVEQQQREQSSETILAERHKALASETRRHENALRKAYGDDFESLAVCPLCLADGWVVPAPPGAMSAEQWEAVQLASGQLADKQYRQADYTETCDACDGKAKLRTGSDDEHNLLIPCRVCEGKGWKAKLDAPALVPTFTLPQPPPANGTASIDWTRPKDNWGRPEGHPHFGMEPSLVGLG